MMPLILFAVAVLLLVLLLFGGKKQPAGTAAPLPSAYRQVLLQDVVFYQQLDAPRRADFEKRIQRFLSSIRIVGVGTDVTDKDKVYIASAAVIPIFGLGDWEYSNLDEVLLYPGAFDHDFQQSGEGRNILGIVGEGALQRVMVLSQHELRTAFQQQGGSENTAIHEFVHLIDKADGSTDGVPEFFIGREYIKPWLQRIHREIQLIRENDSDINPYGITNEAEFFAVASEYFFEQPERLSDKHPELYQLLVKAFHQDPADKSTAAK